MSTGKGFRKFCERIKSEKPVCRCGYGGKLEQHFGKCFSKGKDGNCYLKTGANCKYAKKWKGENKNVHH